MAEQSPESAESSQQSQQFDSCIETVTRMLVDNPFVSGESKTTIDEGPPPLVCYTFL